jgi:hypothetical protein
MQGAPSGRRFSRGWGGGGGYVLTRLHARYTKGAVGDDLVFREAPPIVGGREMRAFGTSLEQTPSPSSFNKFQARYAIRHPWTGAMTCEHPVRDVWGGPPSGHGDASPRAATKLAFADRGASRLGSFIGYHQTTAPNPSTAASNVPAAAASTAPPSETTASKGCGCGVAPSSVPAAFSISSFALLVLGIVRRRRT